MLDFNPRSPHGERRQEAGAHVKKGEFQPTLPARGATTSKGTMPLQSPFQPTLPARGATLSMSCCTICPENFNPRSPHGERRKHHCRSAGGYPISTHAPRTGSDADARLPIIQLDISTHAPRTGSDLRSHLRLRQYRAFQPTLPARGATRRQRAFWCYLLISTHAPRTGSDAHKTAPPRRG